MNVIVNEMEIALALLYGFPFRLENLIVNFDVMGNKDKIFTPANVRARLLQEEQRFSTRLVKSGKGDDLRCPLQGR